MTTQPLTHIKALALSQLLHKHANCYVHIDPRVAGCILPEHVRKTNHQVLFLGESGCYEMHIGNGGFRALLSFNGVRFTVEVLWSAVFAIVAPDNSGRAFEESMPSELVGRYKTPTWDGNERRKTPRKRLDSDRLPTIRSPRNRRVPLGWGVIDGGRK